LCGLGRGGCVGGMGVGKLAKLLKQAFSKCNSFTADTLVHTENGLKPIEELKVGDKVLSYDERTETTSYQPVMAIIQGEQRYQLIKITLNSGESIEATAEHPFYIKGKGWNPANSLKVGETLQLHNGTTVVVKVIDTSIRVEKVYNLTVANTHNYFVGVDGVLVHNCDPNKLHHIFDKVEHKLDGFIDGFGGDRAKAFQALEDAATNLVQTEQLQGKFEREVEINGHQITVRGFAVGNIAKIGTAFKK
jgi:hypothetical protein